MDLFIELLYDHQVQVPCITETWFSDEGNVITSTIKEAGYEIEHAYRSKRGGGAAIIWKNNLKVKCNFKRKCYDTFQYTNVVLDGNVKIHLICVYRLQETSVTQFMYDLNELLAYHTSNSDTIILVGDFNFHFEFSESNEVKSLVDLTSTYGLSQLVVGPSHKLGHTLDLVFANIHEFDLPIIHPLDLNVSDHSPILFNLPIYSPTKSTAKKVQYRNIKSIDRGEFSRKLCSSLNDRFQSIDTENLEFSEHYKMFAECATEKLIHLPP